MSETDWRAAITALCGADTIEAMLAWAARQEWVVDIGWRPYPGQRGYRAYVFVANPRSEPCIGHPTDPAEALARAVLAAVAMGEERI